MGFYVRKSIKAGPFRFNLSKSGLGISTGVPGFRVGAGPRGNYVHMGRNGIYYRASLSGGQRAAASVPPHATEPSLAAGLPAYSPGEIVMGDTTGVTAFTLEPTGPDDLVQQLNTAAGRFVWWLPTAIAGALIALPSPGILGLVIVVLLIPACTWLYFNDQGRRTVVLFYEVEDTAEQWFQALVNQWPWLSQSRRLWRITESGDVNTLYQFKRNAGASRLVGTVAATAGVGGPAELKTNIEVPSIAAGQSALYFLPDRLLIRDGKRFADINYEHLQVFPSTQRFVESDEPPADGTAVDTTWLYVNKGGGPDRRFNNNRQLPVMLYGRIALSTSTGLRWIIQISRHQAAEPVAREISKGSRYARQVQRTQDRAISTNAAQIVVRADQQNALFLKGDAEGIYGQFPPEPLGDVLDQHEVGSAPKLKLVSRTGKPRLWRDHPERDEVMIQVDIRPVVPDTRWWTHLMKAVADQKIKVQLGAVARGGIATSAENIAAVPASIAAIDAAIASANESLVSAVALGEVERYVAAQRSAKLAKVHGLAKLDLESLSELLAKPDLD